MKFKIVADASCDIPKEFMEKYDITIIPIEVMFGEELYPEGLETREFYKKMQEAQSLLRTTSLPVSLIAAKVGYSNFAHFSTSYKKLFHRSPQEERQNP